jgi:hypothetical protein
MSNIIPYIPHMYAGVIIMYNLYKYYETVSMVYNGAVFTYKCVDGIWQWTHVHVGEKEDVELIESDIQTWEMINS